MREAISRHLGRDPDMRIVDEMAADGGFADLLNMPTGDADLSFEYRLREEERVRDGESTIVLRTGRRERALTSILEQDASDLPRVAEFRRFVLEDQLMSRQTVPAWIDRAAKVEGPATKWVLMPQNPEERPVNERDRLDQVRTGPNGWRPQFRRIETVAYVGESGVDVERVPVNAWGDLALLKTAAEDVGALARIAEWWAVEFVLTGDLRIPQATYTATSHSRYPALDRLQLNFSLSVSTPTASTVHREALRFAGRQARIRDIDDRHADMAILVHRYNDGRTWGDLYELFTSRYGREHLTRSNFDRDCRAAYLKVTGTELQWKNERGRPPKKRRDLEEGS